MVVVKKQYINHYHCSTFIIFTISFSRNYPATGIGKYVLIGIGFGLLIGAGFFCINTRKFTKKALVSRGMVIDLVESRSAKGSLVYRPIVKFTTRDSKSIRFESSWGSDPPTYEIGEEIEMLYDEKSPYDARIKSFFS